jgi:hypothetical protein
MTAAAFCSTCRTVAATGAGGGDAQAETGANARAICGNKLQIFFLTTSAQLFIISTVHNGGAGRGEGQAHEQHQMTGDLLPSTIPLRGRKHVTRNRPNSCIQVSALPRHAGNQLANTAPTNTEGYFRRTLTHVLSMPHAKCRIGCHFNTTEQQHWHVPCVRDTCITPQHCITTQHSGCLSSG